MKKKLIATLLVLGIVVLIFLLYGKGAKINRLSDEEIKEVYIEVLYDNEMFVEKVSLEEKDASLIKKILTEEESGSDNGFVFAEGGYRIVVDTGEEIINFYPYCGDASVIRVGDKGSYYVWPDEDEEEVLQSILDKYNKGRNGIWDWNNEEADE